MVHERSTMLPEAVSRKRTADLADFAGALRQDLDLVERHGGLIGRKFGSVDAVVAEILFLQMVLIETDDGICRRGRNWKRTCILTLVAAGRKAPASCRAKPASAASGELST